jgi:hypothetical protein
MNGLEEMAGIFKELNLENQSRLFECSQISQIAENAVKKVFSSRCLYDAANGGERKRVIHRGKGVRKER